MPPTPPNNPPDLGKALRSFFSQLNKNMSAYQSRPARTGRPGIGSVPNPAKKEYTPTPFTNPLTNIFKTVSSALTQFTKKPVREDYHAVVRAFLPNDAVLLTPKLPGNPSDIHLYDLDGDTKDKLLATYKYNNEIRSLILKKQDGFWQKTEELHHGSGDSVHYRGFANIFGDGSKQLLVGVASQGKPSILHGYALHQNKAAKAFDLPYHRLDVLEPDPRTGTAGKTRLGVWNKENDAAYRIELLHWNNHQLESVKDVASYYNAKVVPYHALKVRQAPNSPASWYNLADSLVKAGAVREARQAIQVGTYLDTEGKFKESFSNLKNKIAP